MTLDAVGVGVGPFNLSLAATPETLTKRPEAIATDQAMAEKNVQSSLRLRGAMPSIYALKVTGCRRSLRLDLL